jgi:hypothetical protein
LVLVFLLKPGTAGTDMLRRFLKHRLAAFEHQWSYDASYLKDIAETSPSAMAKIALARPLFRHRDGAPGEAWFAASATAIKAADCPLCLALPLEMARRDGIPSALVEAIAASDEATMSEDAALGYAFARALLAHDHEALARLRARIVARWGRKALVSLSIAVGTASFYPTLKYGMGPGRPGGDVAATLLRRRVEAA